MKTYRVNIDFKIGPSFGCTVTAHNPAMAIATAIVEAVSLGFSETVKKSRVTEV